MNRNDVIEKEKSYIGHYSNPNVFTRWYAKDNKKHAWCGMFQDYVIKYNFKCDWFDGYNVAYIPTIVKMAKDKKWWDTKFKNAKKGDLVIYNWYPEKKNHYSHVGMVYEVKSSGIVSIEGNTTSGVKDNCVAKKSRNKKYIAGIVHLPYQDQFDLTRPLKKGCKGADVKELQTELKKRGYDIGKYGIDSNFGGDTQKAVKQFQKDKGLTADGIVGRKTAHALGWLYKGK